MEIDSVSLNNVMQEDPIAEPSQELSGNEDVPEEKPDIPMPYYSHKVVPLNVTLKEQIDVDSEILKLQTDSLSKFIDNFNKAFKEMNEEYEAEIDERKKEILKKKLEESVRKQEELKKMVDEMVLENRLNA